MSFWKCGFSRVFAIISRTIWDINVNFFLEVTGLVPNFQFKFYRIILTRTGDKAKIAQLVKKCHFFKTCSRRSPAKKFGWKLIFFPFGHVIWTDSPTRKCIKCRGLENFVSLFVRIVDPPIRNSLLKRRLTRPSVVPSNSFAICSEYQWIIFRSKLL